MMNDWGWNPSTVQVIISSVVAFLTLGLIWFLHKDAEASRKSAEAAQASADVLVQEADSRTRPWLGLSECNFTPSEQGNDATEEDMITIHYLNVGALPAQDAVLTLRLLPNMGDTSEAHTFEDEVVGTVFPQEPGLNFFSSALLRQWRAADGDVAIEGVLKYISGNRDFITKFKGSMEFYEDELIGRPAWWNTETT